jgi:hypothetical protein
MIYDFSIQDSRSDDQLEGLPEHWKTLKFNAV